MNEAFQYAADIQDFMGEVDILDGIGEGGVPWPCEPQTWAGGQRTKWIGTVRIVGFNVYDDATFRYFDTNGNAEVPGRGFAFRYECEHPLFDNEVKAFNGAPCVIPDCNPRNLPERERGADGANGANGQTEFKRNMGRLLGNLGQFTGMDPKETPLDVLIQAAEERAAHLEDVEVTAQVLLKQSRNKKNTWTNQYDFIQSCNAS